MKFKLRKFGPIFIIFLLVLTACNKRQSASELVQEIEAKQSSQLAELLSERASNSSSAPAVSHEESATKPDEPSQEFEPAESEETVIQEESSSETVKVKVDALSQAKFYVRRTNLSEWDLRNQLRIEGYSPDEIDYAVMNCGADWNLQAAGRAQYYYDTQSFSRAELYDQLLQDGFTPDQAEYGAVFVIGY